MKDIRKRGANLISNYSTGNKLIHFWRNWVPLADSPVKYLLWCSSRLVIGHLLFNSSFLLHLELDLDGGHVELFKFTFLLTEACPVDLSSTVSPSRPPHLEWKDSRNHSSTLQYRSAVQICTTDLHFLGTLYTLIIIRNWLNSIIHGSKLQCRSAVQISTAKLSTDELHISFLS